MKRPTLKQLTKLAVYQWFDGKSADYTMEVKRKVRTYKISKKQLVEFVYSKWKRKYA